MLTDEQREYAGKVARVLQVIVAALIAGPTAFIGYVLFAGWGRQFDADEATMLPYFGVAFAILAVFAALIVPRLIIARTRACVIAGVIPPSVQQFPGAKNAGDVGPLMAGFQAKTIAAAALIEGAVFFNTFVYLTERQLISIATAVVLAVGMATLFPFRGRILAWLESELATIKQLRAFQD